MTREEELYETADNFSEDHKYEEDLDYVSLKMAFIEGAEWADNHPINVWHDTREKPKIGEQILGIDYDGVTGSGTFNIKSTTGIFTYDTLILDWDSIVRWAYITDLLPKGDEQ